MTRREQAQALFKQGMGIADIAREMNTCWSQARGMADPDGPWRLDPVPKACIGCGETKPPEAFPRNHNNRDRHETRCKDCCKLYVSQKRLEREAERTPIPEPDKLYLCPYCNTPRQGHFEREHYGRYFRSQKEADKCCDRGGEGYKRIGANPTPGKYEGMFRIALPYKANEHLYLNHTKIIPTMSAGLLYGSALK